jgi:flagellar L-ring protein precursor FlgH
MVRNPLVLAVIGALLAATPVGAQNPLPPSKDTYDAAVQRHLETARALVRASAAQADEPSIDWVTSLTSDRRASRVNDLITVRVVENIESSATADSALDKNSNGSAGVPTLFGLETKLPSAVDPANLMSTNSETTFKGGGTTSRTSMLTATMTARVSEVLPNGDLLLEGVRELDLNGERQVVVLTGVVRAQDVRRSNQVLSTQIAQLRIQYYGRGLMKDNLKPGWLLRIMNKIF